MKKRVKKSKRLNNILIIILLIEIIVIFILGYSSSDKEEGMSSRKPWFPWFFSRPECSDGKDNDGDGFCDFDGCYSGRGRDRIWLSFDPDCMDSDDDSELCIPSEEICDGIDNDCNGQIDEELTKDCGITTEGICRYGRSKCSDGIWGECEGEINPQEEICDYLDNDCDGLIDEDLTKQCGISNVGECKYGVSACSFGVWGGCSGNIEPSNETCDGLDNDCDGTIDDGCQCVDGQTKQCRSNTGECEYGLQTCSGGIWGACLGGTLPKTEICDGLDNDCNGLIDEVCKNETI